MKRSRRQQIDTGTRVLVHGKPAVIKFVGEPEFAEGVFLGVELEEPTGKNDGTVHGKRYFRARANHGLFVRPSRATLHGVTVDKLMN